MGLDFNVVPEFLDLILIGAMWTIAITLVAAAISLGGGVLFAIIALYGHWLVRYPVKFFAWLFMGTPLLLQLFLIYFGLVQVGIDLPAFVAGVIGLGLHFAVYNSDIIQAGILAVDKGQTEGGRTLGLSQLQTIYKIIVPQALRNTLPPIGNNIIALLKDSALVSVIGVTELIHASQLAISETFRPFEFYITAAVCYYIINLVLEAILRKIENNAQIAR